MRSIEKAGAKAGVDVRVDALPGDAGEDDVRARLRALGDDPLVHGIILQQPLPRAPGNPADRRGDAAAQGRRRRRIRCNLGRLAFASGTEFVPATPLACMLLLERSERWPLRGVRACVVGRSNVVGLPVALLLMARDATVTIVTQPDARSRALYARCGDRRRGGRQRPASSARDMIAPGATVIDVGTTYVDGKLAGDVAFDEVAAIAGEITPVPGGVGPVTNVALLRNVVLAAERQRAG